MATIVDSSRAEMLSEVRAKRATALRYARGGNPREEEYWLRVAGRLTGWIEQLEHHSRAPGVPIGSYRGIVIDSAHMRLPVHHVTPTPIA